MLYFPFQAVAEIIVSKYFSTKGIRVVSEHICELSLAEATFISFFLDYSYAILINMFHFTEQPLVCAVADTVCMRFVNGTKKNVGILGVDYSTASWLYS